MEIYFEMEAPPSLELAREVRSRLSPILADNQVPGANDFLLAVSELLVNLCHHPDPAPDRCWITLTRELGLWGLEILDNGAPFNGFASFHQPAEELQAGEGGMGLRLICQLFPDISYCPGYQRLDHLNLIRLTRTDEERAETMPLIMVIDDDPVQLALIQSFLADSYRVKTVQDSSGALEEIVRYKPALVLCDIRMPELDGFSLYDQLMRVAEFKTLPFILMSGSKTPEHTVLARQRPIDDFLTKPLSKALLESCISRALLRRAHLQTHYQQQLNTLLTLGLKPTVPDKMGEFEAAVRSRQPTPGGGDLLIHHWDGENHLLIFADLMGHGSEAHRYSYALAGYLRGLCVGMAGKLTPAQLLSQISVQFNSDEVLSTTLATLMVIKLAADGVVTLANAGHPAPVHISETDQTALDINGPLPGMLTSSALYQQHSLFMRAGERLVCWSDGLNDAAEPIAPVLQTILAQGYQQPPLRLCQTLINRYPITLTQEVDDATVLVIARG